MHDMLLHGGYFVITPPILEETFIARCPFKNTAANSPCRYRTEVSRGEAHAIKYGGEGPARYNDHIRIYHPEIIAVSEEGVTTDQAPGQQL